MKTLAVLVLLWSGFALGTDAPADRDVARRDALAYAPMERVRVAADGRGFVLGETSRAFHPGA